MLESTRRDTHFPVSLSLASLATTNSSACNGTP
jgi:hypothetical protein